MSITAGYLPTPSPGRWTSPTRFTPSLAGMVTSGSVVMSAACAGAAAPKMPPATATTAATRADRSRSTEGRVDPAARRRPGTLLRERERARPGGHAGAVEPDRRPAPEFGLPRIELRAHRRIA